MYVEYLGGGNVCMGDGLVYFIVEIVDLIIWVELSSMVEGEVVEW